MIDDPDIESLEREAHGWVTELVSGRATVTDAEALKRWRAQSPRHEEAFAAAARLWKDFGTVLERQEAPVRPFPRPLLSRRALLGGAGAFAAAATYLTLRPPFGLWPSFDELRADYRTATGEQRSLTLANDVSVHMNTQTSIAVQPGTTGRITMIVGEAVFATSGDSARPLEVYAGTGRTVANRARFDVRTIDTVVCVTCLEGEVSIEQGARGCTLQAGRQLRYDDRGLGEIVAANPTEVASWQDGVLIFRLTPLADVVDEVNRYRPGKVVLLNNSLAARQVNGRFRIQRIDEVLGWIEQAFDLKSRTLPGGVVLLS